MSELQSSPPPIAPTAASAAPPRGARDPRDPRTKSPLLAGILSVIPGLGQVYLGYYQRGFVHAIVVASIITLLGTTTSFNPALPFAAMFLIFFWLYNIIDAARRANYVNTIVAGGEALDVPDDFKSAGLRGSFLGGGLMIGVGLIALGYTVFDIPLDWIETWWPLAPIGFGAYLVWKAIEERKAATS